MLGVALEHNNQGGYVDESWWTDADLKVMVFGQEASCFVKLFIINMVYN